jgi:hypothetical protein
MSIFVGRCLLSAVEQFVKAWPLERTCSNPAEFHQFFNWAIIRHNNHSQNKYSLRPALLEEIAIAAAEMEGEH